MMIEITINCPSKLEGSLNKRIRIVSANDALD